MVAILLCKSEQKMEVLQYRFPIIRSYDSARYVRLFDSQDCLKSCSWRKRVAKSPVLSPQPRVSSHEPRITNNESRTTSHGSRTMHNSRPGPVRHVRVLGPDTVIAGRVAGIFFLILESRRHRMGEIEHSLKRMEHNGVKAQGIIMNNVKMVSSGYGYGYGYGYSYQYR